jgi:GR25 family glycosyltransferase involved in LPS biosynthesis
MQRQKQHKKYGIIVQMELFEHTLFINLENRPDRLEHSQKEFEKLGIQAERVNAIKMKNGAVGCTMSHIKCIELAKARDYKQVFICEDDIAFLKPDILKTNITRFDNNDDINWDVLIIGGNNVPPYQQVEDYCARVFYCQTTTGYIVKRHYYDTLLKNFRESAANLVRNPENKKQYALDIYWKRLQIQDFWYMITPPTVTQYENYSDIEECATNYDFLMLDMEKTWYMERMKQARDYEKNSIGMMKFT